MARRKGQTMTEAQKIAMRAKRRANKEGKANAFDTIASNLKYLSFSELEDITELALLERRKKLDSEETRLLKEKEEIETQIRKLKEIR